MDPVQQYHGRLRRLWRQWAGQPAALPGMERMPYLGQLPEGAATLLFLGVNPSYREDVLAQHWVQCFGEAGVPFDPARLQWDAGRTDAELDALEQQLVALDTHSRANYRSYYGIPTRIAQALGAEHVWHALDLFPMRVTVQAQLVQVIPANGAMPEPAQQLLQAFVELLQALRPRLVIVANAYASRLLVKHLPLTRTGTGSRYACPVLPATTFLLGGMLTGAGAMDEFSRERLVAEALSVWATGAPAL